MSKTEEDLLLKEVDEELQQDRAKALWDQYGAWIIGAAVAVVVGVAGNQVWSGMKAREAAQSAEAYQAALEEGQDNPELAADAMRQVAGQLNGGYSALAELRAGGLALISENKAEALASYARVYEDAGTPDRLRDMARLRAANILVDQDAPQATALVDAIQTDAFKPYGQEIKALAAMKANRFQEAYALFNGLITDPETPSDLRQRAQLVLPVADAGRNGVSLTQETNEAEDFLDSFMPGLEEELGLNEPEESVTPDQTEE